MGKQKRVKKEKSFSNQAFAELSALQKKRKKRKSSLVRSMKEATPKPEKKTPKVKLSDEELFLRAMSDVQPIVQKSLYQPTEEEHSLSFADDDAKALRELKEVIDGRQYFDIQYSDEFIEGTVHGLDPRMMLRLRKGEFSWRSHLDLHGMTSDDARLALESFVQRAYREGFRCILVVHGRGLHSPGKSPVLKQRLIHWMTRGFLRKQVLAFSTARPHDGGAGATYILLRKRR